jgi:hypothetical protein
MFERPKRSEAASITQRVHEMMNERIARVDIRADARHKRSSTPSIKQVCESGVIWDSMFSRAAIEIASCFKKLF